jgi:AraC-like DNA-binding protein
VNHALVERLRTLVDRHAPVEGRSDSNLEGVYFYRSSRPTAKRWISAPALAVGAIVQGSKVIRAGDRVLRYGELDCLLLTGEMEYWSEVADASPSAPYLSVNVNVPPELVVKTLLALSDAGGEPASSAPDAYVARLDASLADALARLIEATEDPIGCRVLAPIVLEELVFHLLRSDAAHALRASAQRRGDETRIQEAMAFMRSNAARRLTVGAIAKRVGMSASHFAHRFRAVARVTPMRFLKTLRLQEARLFLVERGARASEAADRVGYSSASHFTRDFKSHFGVTPGEYARRLRGGERARESAPTGT